MIRNLRFKIIVIAIICAASCSCTKSEMEPPQIDSNHYYSEPQISQKIDSLKQLYNCNFDYDLTENCVLSDDTFNKLEELLRNSSPTTKSVEYGEGDDSELLIHCITAINGDGGEDIIGNNFNDTDNVTMTLTDGYHKPGESKYTSHNRNCRYMRVTFNAFLLPWIYISFNGVVEQKHYTDDITWVEESVVYKGGVWDWDPGDLYYFYNDVALASEYNGTKKSEIIDKITGGIITIRIRERFVFIIYNLTPGALLDIDKVRELTLRGYFTNEEPVERK